MSLKPISTETVSGAAEGRETGEIVAYRLTRPSLRPQLIAEATRDARRRALALVEATGGRLGGLRSVSVGVFQVTTPNSTEVSDYGSTTPRRSRRT